ncbi:MAG: hypothetical protein AAFV54_13235, partial [Pseudomonadota bacterium]
MTRFRDSANRFRRVLACRFWLHAGSGLFALALSHANWRTVTMKCVRKLLLAVTAMLPFTAFAGNSYLIDFVVMNEGYGLEERDNYEAIVARIASRYGMEKVRAYDLTQHLGGGLPTASRLNVWEVPEGAMQKLGADPDYQAIIPYRDRIHNMKEVSLFMAGETLGGREPTADTILVDLVVMKGGR